MTNRQSIAWGLWLDEQLNRPSRTDHYLIQIACEVRRIFAFLAGGVVPEMTRMVLSFKRQKPTEITKESMAEQVRISKAAWIGAVNAVKPEPKL